eukprot:7389583-Prymnesium_polylepis.2
MELSEEREGHARTARLKFEFEKAATKWFKRSEAAKEEAAAANVRAAESGRQARASAQETRRLNLQNLALQRRLDLVGDAVPRAEFVAMRARL